MLTQLLMCCIFLLIPSFPRRVIPPVTLVTAVTPMAPAPCSQPVGLLAAQFTGRLPSNGPNVADCEDCWLMRRRNEGIIICR